MTAPRGMELSGRRLALGALVVGAIALIALAFVGLTRPRGAVEGTMSEGLDPRALAWRRVTLDDLAAQGIIEITHLASVGNRFIGFATGEWDEQRQLPTSAVVVSDDGLTWQPISGPIADLRVDTTTVVDGVIWAFGQVGDSDTPEHQIWTSRDGLAWGQLEGVRGLEFGPGFVQAVARGNNGWVALAWDAIDVESSVPLVLASADGRTWEQTTMPRKEMIELQAVAAGPGGFVVAVTFEDELGATHAVAWHSPDGRDWTERVVERGANVVTILDVAGTMTGYVAVGFDALAADWRPATWISADGLTWQRGQVSPIGGTGQIVMNSVSIAGRGLVAVGQAYAVEDRPVAWVSADGATWDLVPDWPGELGDFSTETAAGDRLVVIAGQRGTVSGATPIVWVGMPR